MSNVCNATVRFLKASEELGAALREVEVYLSGDQGDKAKELHSCLNDAAELADQALGLPKGMTVAFGGGGEKD